MNKPKIGDVKVTPVYYKTTGFVEVPEGEQDLYSVSIYKVARGYGEGWFPLYDFQSGVPADAYGYMYRDKKVALMAASCMELQ